MRVRLVLVDLRAEVRLLMREFGVKRRAGKGVPTLHLLLRPGHYDMLYVQPHHDTEHPQSFEVEAEGADSDAGGGGGGSEGGEAKEAKEEKEDADALSSALWLSRKFGGMFGRSKGAGGGK